MNMKFFVLLLAMSFTQFSQAQSSSQVRTESYLGVVSDIGRSLEMRTGKAVVYTGDGQPTNYACYVQLVRTAQVMRLKVQFVHNGMFERAVSELSELDRMQFVFTVNTLMHPWAEQQKVTRNRYNHVPHNYKPDQFEIDSPHIGPKKASASVHMRLPPGRAATDLRNFVIENVAVRMGEREHPIHCTNRSSR